MQGGARLQAVVFIVAQLAIRGTGDTARCMAPHAAKAPFAQVGIVIRDRLQIPVLAGGYGTSGIVTLLSGLLQ